MKDVSVWGIHGGKTGDADSFFLKRGRVALGWTKLGDLSGLKPDREAFKARLAEMYPEKKAGAIPVDAGQLFRFIHEMKIGDLVVYPSKRDRKVNIGRIEGPYQYDPKTEPGYPHTRTATWIKDVPRTRFTQGALYEFGTAMSFFSVKDYADEIRAVLETGVPATPIQQDPSVAVVSEDIEQTTRDFVLKQLAQELKGHPFAEFVANLLNVMGYRTRISPEGADGGIDIVAHRDQLGFEPPIVKVQVKSGEGSIGDPVVSALYGKVGEREFGLLVSLGSFTAHARNFAKSKSNLRLVDGDELVDLIFEHYEKFDSRYKGLLPLRKVYVPVAIDSNED